MHLGKFTQGYVVSYRSILDGLFINAYRLLLIIDFVTFYLASTGRLAS